MYKRIFITGDTHGDRLKLKRIIKEKSLTSGDVLIITGDFGFIMGNTSSEDSFLDELSRSTDCHIAFVLGNHEHFPRIFEHPETTFCGGKALRIRSNIFCLLNGEVFTLPTVNGEKSFFVMGGAASIDKGMNPFRYATVWLKIHKSKGLAEIVNRDDIGYAERVEGFKPITDRKTCHKLTELIYQNLDPLVAKYMPSLIYNYRNLSAFNEDTLRFTEAIKIKAVAEDLVLSRFEDVRQEFYRAIYKAFEDFGVTDDKVRFVLKEGTWFPQELPSAEDYKRATANLKSRDMKVDYILSHTMPRKMIIRYGCHPYHKDNELTGFLEWLMYDCDYKMQYCGHWHEDTMVGDKLTLIFHDVIEISR